MRKVIYKYKVPALGENNIYLPTIGAKILCVSMEKTEMMLWAEISIEETTESPRTIQIYPTGQELPSNVQREYINTVFDGPYVWHAYEVLP